MDVTAHPLVEPETLRGTVLVVFTDVAMPKERALGKGEGDAVHGRPKTLARELQHAHAELQTTREEMQTAQEPLRSANE